MILEDLQINESKLPTFNTWVRRLMDTESWTASGSVCPVFPWQACCQKMTEKVRKKKNHLTDTVWHHRVGRPINDLITNWKFSTPSKSFHLLCQLLHYMRLIKVNLSTMAESISFLILHVKWVKAQKSWLLYFEAKL